MQSGASSASDQATASAGSQNASSGALNATTQVELSPGTARVVSRRVSPSYPLLAKQMKVQGAVVLEALIGKQWHFKPYYQGRRPVETEARITVNFTISTY